MFTDFIVKNFRGFPGLHLKGLERINLIAGMNNTGKTALLEAIHLHNNPADCQLAITINKARGVLDPGRAVEDIVSWLFWGRHTGAGLQAQSWDDKGVTRGLEMWVLDAAGSRERFAEGEKLLRDGLRPDLVDANLPRLVLRYEESNQVQRTSMGVFAGNGLASMSAKIPWRISSIYLPSGVPSADQDIRYFGELEAAKRQDEVLPPLQILEPRLRRLALVPLSLEPVLHGDIGLTRLVPVAFMGEGVRRVLSVVLAIANAPGGVVLIDEIENGLHYSVMQKVWKAIGDAARKANVQVFATTHSGECIQAAHRAFRENGPYELRYHRLDRQDNEIVVKSLDERMLERVQDTDLEIR